MDKDFIELVIQTLFSSIHSPLGSEKIVQMLIEKGANVNAVHENAGSALIIAAFKGKRIQIYVELIVVAYLPTNGVGA